MKIGVDAGCLGIVDKRLQVGVYQVVKNLLIELGKQANSNEYLLYSFYPIDKNLLNEFGPKMKNSIVRPSKGWLKIWLPLRLAIDRPDIFLALNQSTPLKLPTQNYKIVGLFYDIAFEKFPQLYAYATSVQKHRENSRYVAAKADRIVTISKTTKKDLENFYHVAPEKITVGHLGISTLSKTKPYRSSHPYFLFVGAFKKSKNIPTLLQAFSIFFKKSPKTYDLLLVGGDKWMDPEIEEVLQTIPKKIRDHMRILGFVDDVKLSALYRGAVAFVGPSWYEGFGLPFVEAQSVGCPVVGSSGGSLPEILGSSALLIDPKSEEKLAEAMEEVAVNTVLREKLVAKGFDNAKKYSWKSFANTVQSAIETLL